MRPKTANRDLPPRMIRVRRVLRNGNVWEAFYYNGRDAENRRIKIPLGQDLALAKLKWAELERTEEAREIVAVTMGDALDRFLRDVVPTKAPKTQRDYKEAAEMLRKVFGSAPFAQIKPMHIRGYLDRRPAKVRANREIALFSNVWNRAREWGYTDAPNPTRGVSKHKEAPRDFYVTDAVFKAVYEHADSLIRAAMDIGYLTGQRPADVLAMRWSHVREGAIEVKQAKTGKKLRILIAGQLADVLARLRAQPVTGMHLVANEAGQRLTKWTVRQRWEKARTAAAEAYPDLADDIRQFSFRDLRPKAASDATDLAHASKLLGHTEQAITKTVYRRVGETVKPTK